MTDEAQRLLGELNEATREEGNAYADVYMLRTMGLPDDNLTLHEKIAEHSEHVAARHTLQVAYDLELGMDRWKRGSDGV